MKVLLCSPFDSEGTITSGGIATWAKNIVDSCRNDPDISIQVLPLNRRVYIGEKTGVIRRSFEGIIDYSKHACRLLSILKSFRPDLVHLCTSGSLGFIKDLFFLHLTKKTKRIIHFHFGRIPDIIQQHNWEYKLLKKVIQISDRVIVMDLMSYKSLISIGCSNIDYVPNPLSNSVIENINSVSIKRIPNKVLFVGHMDLLKGVVDLVNACSQINGIELHLIGRPDVNTVSKVETIVSSSHQNHWLFIHGEKPHEEILKEMLSSQVFCLPSYTEGFPNVILESMAAACSIVATNVGAIPEMLNIDSSEPCGICVSPGDIQMLKDSIQSALESYTPYGIRASKRVKDCYSIPIVMTKLKKIWNSICF